MNNRTELDKITRKGKPVILGGKKFIIFPQPLRISLVWKQKAQSIINHFQELMQLSVKAQKDNESIQLSDLLEAARKFLFEDMNSLLDLIIIWQEDLEKEREFILNNCYEDELFSVILIILELAFPFGNMLKEIIPEIK